MERRETFIHRHYFIAAVLLTIGGYLSLRLGGISVQWMSPDVAEVTSYIVPFVFLIAVRDIFKIKESENIAKVYDENNPKTVRRFVMVVLVGLVALAIPLFLSITGDISQLIGKPFAENVVFILIQVILLNLCIGIFEEGLFRNLMMKVIITDNRKSTYVKAFFITSILFGLIHLGNLTLAAERPIAITSQVIYATFMGMLMAGLYLKYRNFYSLVFLHALFDFISMIPKLYGQNADIATGVIPDITVAQGINTVVTMIPTAIVGLILLRSFLKKNVESA